MAYYNQWYDDRMDERPFHNDRMDQIKLLSRKLDLLIMRECGPNSYGEGTSMRKAPYQQDWGHEQQNFYNYNNPYHEDLFSSTYNSDEPTHSNFSWFDNHTFTSEQNCFPPQQYEPKFENMLENNFSSIPPTVSPQPMESTLNKILKLIHQSNQKLVELKEDLSEHVAQQASHLNEKLEKPPHHPCMDSMNFSEDYCEIISRDEDQVENEMHVDEQVQIPNLNQAYHEEILNNENQEEGEVQDDDKEQISKQLKLEEFQDESSEKEITINPSEKENSSIPLELHKPSFILPQRVDEHCINSIEMDIDDHTFRKISLSVYLDPYLDTNSIFDFAGNHKKTMLQEELVDITSGDSPNFTRVRDATQQDLEKYLRDLVFERLGIG